MCLFKDDKYHPPSRPLIAEEDIVCYKAAKKIIFLEKVNYI